MSKFATYTGHYRDLVKFLNLHHFAIIADVRFPNEANAVKLNAEGHIHLDKEGACTIRLQGASSMPQNELDRYGKIMAEALTVELEIEDE